MKILVTGATGFLGSKVVEFLRDETHHEVTASGRYEAPLRSLGCDYSVYDLHARDPHCWQRLGRPDAVIHLAWESLHDYWNPIHIEQLVETHFAFLDTMLCNGIQMLTCAGTCLEYGRQEGCLKETTPARPVLPYAVAKDKLRRQLEARLAGLATKWRWLRIFYLHGDGQKSNSLIPKLDHAIDTDCSSFAMSPGDQLRDYLPVDLAGEYVAATTLQDRIDGVINICSGRPTAVRTLVEQRMRERGKILALQLGHYPYANYEPKHYWGDTNRLRLALQGNKSSSTLPAHDEHSAQLSTRSLLAARSLATDGRSGLLHQMSGDTLGRRIRP